MGWTILLTILFVLAVILLLPVRVKGFFAEGKWGVSVYYAWFRLFHKESEEKAPPVTPPKPEDVPAGETPSPEQMPEAPPGQQEHAPEEPAHPPADEKPKPAAAEAVPKPETVTAEPADDDPFLAEESPKERKKREKREKREERRRKKEAKKAEQAAAEEQADSEDTEETENSEDTPKKKKRGIRGFIERLKPHSVSDALALAKDACAALSPALRFLTKHLHFRHIKLYAAIGTDDAAKTAERYGAISAAVFNFIGQLQCWVDFQADECRILADFYNDSITFRASGELRVSPLAALLLALILGGKFLWRTIRRFRREDKEAKLREKETAPLPAEA